MLIFMDCRKHGLRLFNIFNMLEPNIYPFVEVYEFSNLMETDKAVDGSHCQTMWVCWHRRHCSAGRRVRRWFLCRCCQTSWWRCHSLHQNQTQCWWRKKKPAGWMYLSQTDHLEKHKRNRLVFIYKSLNAFNFFCK